MLATERFVQVVEEQVAGTDQHIDEAVLDDVGQKPAHPGGDERARTGAEDRRVVAEHVEPDAMRFGQLARAETRALHLLQQPGHRAVAVYLHGARRNRQILRGSRFALSYHIFTNDERGTMNDELKTSCFYFIVHRSYFIVHHFLSFPLTARYV